MFEAPTVSAVIPAYNTRNCVCVAIDSALAQEGVSVEVIVVDDCSQDGTADHVAATYAGDPRVVILRRQVNGGPSAARNIGFEAARGDWIGILDSDDTWQPDRLQRLLSYQQEADFIADNILGYDVVAGVATGPIYHDHADGPLYLVDFLQPKAADKHDLGYLQPLLRRSFLVEHNLRYHTDVRVGEDLLFNLEFLACGGRAYYVDEPLYVYAMPVGVISRAASPHSRSTVNTGPLALALGDLWKRLQEGLTPEENQAFAHRLRALKRGASIAAFHRARAKSDFAEMARLFAREPAVREKIIQRITGGYLPSRLRAGG